IRAFLQKGVPADLTRAALRRAWTTDPAIRDFVGLSENAWDFNAPNGVAGFGPLEMSDEVRRLVADVLGDAPQTEAPTPAPQVAENATESEPADNPTSAADGDTATSASSAESDAPSADVASHNEAARTDAASQHDDPHEIVRTRGHGRALPQ